MYGNVAEWTSDIYVPYHGIPEVPRPFVDPRWDEAFTLKTKDGRGDPIRCELRCIRGGGIDVGDTTPVTRRWSAVEGAPPPGDSGFDKRGLRLAVDAARP